MECTGVAREDDATMTGIGIYDVREQKRTYVVYEKGKAKKLVECLRTNGTTQIRILQGEDVDDSLDRDTTNGIQSTGLCWR